ncbi:MAG TPA: carboxypeptidase-like regulatory domain-containing protein [Bacteroidota bacterium]|nr:carboxypeptidase-like regulatory domain-containing protein [Bacteroidota bacterium]
MSTHAKRSVQIVLALLVMVGMAMWISSCKSKNGNPVSPGGAANSVNGVVRDAGSSSNTALAGATVKVTGGATTTTDANGMFSVSVTPAVNQTITVSKDGYSSNVVVVNLVSGSSRDVTVNLLQTGATKSVAVTAGGTVTDTKSNAVLKLPSGFVTASGNVSVSVTGLDPTSDQIRALPGGLQAVDANGNTKYLQPVSFAEYVVKDANGNVLQFNSQASSGANIELPIPASLRGRPGYQTGDPIECYVYDPTDGKWKTPVPGVVGPSSVDGSPAIKATIFHLSWYGGAPALNQRACINGHVRNSDGSAAVGADVEAFPGGTGTTDQNGFFDIDAAPSSNVRVVASVLSGSTISSAEIVVYTGSSTDSCYAAPDLTLGLPQQGTFDVDATLYKGGSGQSTIDFAAVDIQLQTPAGATSNYDGADVKIGYNGQYTTLPSAGSGSYLAYTGMPGATNFSLSPGQQYDIKIDFDKNGTVDATGSVRMVGVSSITNPASGSTVPNHFTATWSDNGTSVPGYSANYWLTISGDSASRYFLTTTTSKVIGDGSVDSSFYGYYLDNAPLPAGQYDLSVWSFNGPAGFLTVGTPLPNINGQNVTGYFYAYYFGQSVSFNSSGAGSSRAPVYASRAQHWKMPTALKNFYKTIPTVVRKKAGISLTQR